MIDGATVRVAPPSIFQSDVEQGRYLAADDTTCAVGDSWDDVGCYEVASMPGSRVCVGELDGVLVTSPDPCGDVPPADYVELDGLLAWPTDPADFDGMPEVAWPG